MKKSFILLILVNNFIFCFSQIQLESERDSLSDKNFARLYPYQYLAHKQTKIEGVSIQQVYSDVLFIINNNCILPYKRNESVMEIYDYYGNKDPIIGICKIDSINDINFYLIDYSSDVSLGCLSSDKECMSYKNLDNNFLIGIFNKHDDHQGIKVVLASANFRNVDLTVLINNLRNEDIVSEMNVSKIIHNYYSFLKFKKLDCVKNKQTKFLYTGSIDRDGYIDREDDKIECEIKLDTKKNTIKIKTNDKESWLYYAIKKYDL